MFEIDWKLLLLQTANFLVLLLVMRLLLFKPIKGIMEQRSNGIRDLLSDAARERTDAERLRKDYESRLAAAAGEAQQIISQANRTGETIRAEIRQKADQERGKLMELTKDEIAEQRRVVAESLRGESVRLSADMAVKALSDLLDEDARKRLTVEILKRAEDAGR